MIFYHNPMNIRISSTPWHNKDIPPRNDQFETFLDPFDGLHAGFLNVFNCQHLHGCRSISAIINRLSPPTENDTDTYIAAVANACCVGQDDDYDLTVPDHLLAIGEAIIKQENGSMPYDQGILSEVISGILK